MIREQTSSNKVLIIIIAILLVANIATLSLFLLNKKKGDGRDMNDRQNAMRSYLEHDLKFSDTQLNAFDSIREKHKTEMKITFDSMRTNKLLRLKTLARENFTDSSLNIAADVAALQQKKIEMQMLGHLKEIRTLCSPLQIAGFDTGFYKLMTRPQGDVKKKEK